MVKVFLDHQPFFTVLKRIGDNWKKKMRQVFLQRPFARPFGSALLKEFHACGLTEDNLRIIFRSVQLLDHLPFAQSMVEVAMQILMFCDEHDNIYTETTSMQEAIAISMLHFSDAAEPRPVPDTDTESAKVAMWTEHIGRTASLIAPFVREFRKDNDPSDKQTLQREKKHFAKERGIICFSGRPAVVRSRESTPSAPL